MINRCICSNISFEKIKSLALKESYHSLEELQAENICCCNCKLCAPYIVEMLKTGKTTFQLIEAQSSVS